MKTLSLLAFAGLALAPLSSAQALELNEQFSLAITPAIVSDYRASGISQTLGDPAAQLAINLSHVSGVYAGVWASNVDFGHGDEARNELEYYAGYYWQITDDISLDTFVTQYDFSGASQYNQSDVQTTLDAYGVLLGAKYASNTKGPDYEDENGNWQDGEQNEDLTSAFIGYRTVLPAEIGFEARYEYVDYKDEVFWNSDFSSSRADYRDWSVKLSRDLLGVTWGLSYIDTDLSKAECMNFMGYDDVCSATLVASASKTF
ncbi:MAG: TorF family putative porin [Pseudomonas sp.]|uniref:TorF family putative porin n=1 Tax=Pseudomonas sp. TaxID=306 RepID=UPI0027360967|nr:TorF family putative porin [Pseudomonas sp.]MDP3845636.1 TorF family putative porin [Pseudomonas sp.]